MVLPIKKFWFDMILSGVKKEEYREIKPYYISRFKDFGERRWITFRNGYSRTSPSFEALCSLREDYGRPEWGAEEGTKYFVLSVEKIKKSLDNEPQKA